jgi:3'5'-cyclic nucleotide phosphodiesterase
LDIKHSETDRNFALQIALKCADISNPCRVWPLSQRWGQLVCQEFFLQGSSAKRTYWPCRAQVNSRGNVVLKYSCVINRDHLLVSIVVLVLVASWFTGVLHHRT